MIKRFHASVCVAASAVFLLCGLRPVAYAQGTSPHVDYVVTVADPANHLFQDKATATGFHGPTITFAIPAWSPGWYVLTHAYQNVRSVTATDEAGSSLPVGHNSRLLWTVPAGGAKSVTLSYGLVAVDRDPDALDLGPAIEKNYGFFAPYLDDSNGFVPGPAALMYVVDGKSAPCRVTYNVPAGWAIASGNDPTSDQATFSAPDYDTLADQPADLGHFTRVDRTITGVPISVLIVGDIDNDPSKWIDDTFKIARAGISYWGKNIRPPFARYLFQYRFPKGENGGGGLEHLDGTVIQLNPSVTKQSDPEDLELVAHEFFHAWNVKRARPEKLGPFDYTQPVRVTELWWFEGVTDYVAPHLVVNAGLADTTFWRNYVGDEINTLQHNSARKTVTLEESSSKAWEGKSEGFGGLSYYNKGLIVGLLLDIELRHRTGNRVGLDDVMRALYAEEAKSGRGFPPGEIERVTSRLGGSDFRPFFDRALRSTAELPYDDILPAAGLKVVDTVVPTSNGEPVQHVLRLEKITTPTAEQEAIFDAISGAISSGHS